MSFLSKPIGWAGKALIALGRSISLIPAWVTNLAMFAAGIGLVVCGFLPMFGDKSMFQLLTDGDPDLHRYVDEYFPAERFPNRVVTVDVLHVLEKLWKAGRSVHAEGSEELRVWVSLQEDRLYAEADLHPSQS